MGWLPISKSFREDLCSASAIEDPAQRLAELIALSQHQLDFVETLQLARALEDLPSTTRTLLPCVKLAIVSTHTVAHLSAGIRVGGLRRRILVDVHVGQYGQYRQDLLSEHSSLFQFKPDVVLLSLNGRDWIADIPVSASGPEVDRSIERSIEDLRTLWTAVRDRFGATAVQQTFLNVAAPLFGSYDRLVPAAPTRLLSRLNDRLCDAAGSAGAYILDIAGASDRDGLDVWFDATRWLQGKLEISHRAAPLYGDLLGRVLAALRGLSRKCLVLDLDNTLWGGVLGDDGLAGIALGEGSAVGEAHLSLQRYAKQLRDRGIILAVCSKNDCTVAAEAFRTHPEMALRESDIAAFCVNWDDKATNLRRIADQVNIGLESMVFVDDNPVERARVRQSLPMVAVPELPDNASQYVRCLSDAGYFEATAFTPEDQQRSDQYAANIQRDALSRSSDSIEDFLRGLDMSVVAGPVSPVDVERVTQLVNKTNQFNPTTKRYSSSDIAAIIGDGACLSLRFRLIDRFGDNGLVSVMVLRQTGDETDVFDIDTWVMSCRVFGRQLEHEAMNIAVASARERGARHLRAAYLPTARNGIVKDLYSSLGFRPILGDSPEAGTRWLLSLPDYQPRRTYIHRLQNT
jgi:FkbH-like protein